MHLNSSFAQDVNKNKSCEKLVDVSNREICLPEIDGMKECYDIPAVKLKADKFENSGNSILGFYVTNDVYKRIDDFEGITLEEYFKIYVVNNMKDKEYDLSQLNEMGMIIENSFIKDNWDKLKTEVEKSHSYLSIGQPVLIEKYNPNEQTRTYLLIVKIESQGVEYIMLMSVNIILIKDKIIWLAYYKKYEDRESIDIVKSSNDNIVLKFADVNK